MMSLVIRSELMLNKNPEEGRLRHQITISDGRLSDVYFAEALIGRIACVCHDIR
jgi:hypothetical protein